jgi:hypothetical protein
MNPPRGYCQTCAQLVDTHPNFRRPVATIHSNRDGDRCQGSWKPFRALHATAKPRHGIVHRALQTVGMAVMVAASEWAPRYPGLPPSRSYPAPKALESPRSIP